LGPDHAEKQATDQLIAYIDTNIWQNVGWIDWIPGVEGLVRNSPMLRGSRFGSTALAMNGASSNLYDKVDVRHLIDTGKDRGYFTQNPQLYEELLRRYKVTNLHLAIDFVRKNITIIPLMLAYLAYKDIEKDEKTHH
jgi:hypothetical protein